MKTKISILLVLLSLSTMTKAQYSVNKEKYDHKEYVQQAGDPYDPSTASLASVLIPGLGQMLSDEVGRGVGFLAGYSGCWIMYSIGLNSMSKDIINGGNGSSGKTLAWISVFGAIGVNIWSAVDANRVAKVNNLAFRDKKLSSFNFAVEPYLANNQINDKNSIQTGLSIKIKF
jgi:hypothetical protein